MAVGGDLKGSDLSPVEICEKVPYFCSAGGREVEFWQTRVTFLAISGAGGYGCRGD